MSVYKQLRLNFVYDIEHIIFAEFSHFHSYIYIYIYMYVLLIYITNCSVLHHYVAKFIASMIV